MQSQPSEVTTRARRLRLTIAGLAAVGVLLAGPAARAAFLPLPANGSQVNNDVANAIDPNQDAGVSDVAGGTLTAGKVQVPWATFEQKSRDSQQIFVRAFKNGAWVTQGFPASLNIDPTAEAEAPSIDFAGAGRTVPWVAWYEPNAAFGPPTNSCASRFNAGADLWLPWGQDRSGGSHLPSLNIHTDRTAENPSVAGGAAVAGADPVPWVAWEENDGVASDTTLRQIFVVKGLKQATAGAACPVGTLPAGENNENGFCWQQVGLERLDPTSPTSLDKGDPTLNIDPTRSGGEPDIAVTGQGDKVAGNDAENPRVAAGTLTPGNPTVPWVVWQEVIGGGKHAVFVSRLVGGNHFELFNSGQPISNTVNDATRPDITFSGNIPYISWQEEVSGEQVTFVGHFEGGASAPVFKLDTPTGIANSGFGDVANPLRAPISSGCTANPTNADGSACQGGAAGTPFFLYTAGGAGAQKLFAQAYAPSEVSTLAPTDIGNTEATLDGSVNPGGSAIKTHFEFGPTTAYGSTTPDARLHAASVVTSFDATATDLTPGAAVHFRAVAQSDFVALNGADQSFVAQNTPPVVSIDDLPDTVKIKTLGKGRPLNVQLTVSEPATVTVEILNKKSKVLRTVVLDRATAGSFVAQISLAHLRRQ